MNRTSIKQWLPWKFEPPTISSIPILKEDADLLLLCILPTSTFYKFIHFLDFNNPKFNTIPNAIFYFKKKKKFKLTSVFVFFILRSGSDKHECEIWETNSRVFVTSFFSSTTSELFFNFCKFDFRADTETEPSFPFPPPSSEHDGDRLGRSPVDNLEEWDFVLIFQVGGFLNLYLRTKVEEDGDDKHPRFLILHLFSVFCSAHDDII